MATIFISYSRDDGHIVEILVPQIRNIYGEERCWYDISIQGGEDWWKKIVDEIQTSNIFIFLMSDTSIKSAYCLDELKAALSHHKQILQVLLPDLTVDYKHCLPNAIQSRLSTEQYVDLRKAYQEEIHCFADLSRLWGALNRLISSAPMLLSLNERWILHNQFEILKHTLPNQNDYHESYFENGMKVFAYGYEWYYKDFSAHISDHAFPYNDALEIIKILTMFRSLYYSYQELEDVSGIDETTISFVGFSENYETAAMRFTQFMMESMNHFAYLRPQKGFNSHSPMMEKYEKMVRAWQISKNKDRLSKEDILRIVQAGYSRKS